MPVGAGCPTSSVSIHTRHFWRVNCSREVCRAGNKGCFNPHPPFLAGEFSMLRRHPVGQSPVSIHTRHFWRVNLVGVQARTVKHWVSIHTRHFWRVNSRRPWRWGQRLRDVSIHTRHFWRVNCRGVPGAGEPQGGFNPHPPFLAGELLLFLLLASKGLRFNPHPPFLAGEFGRAIRCGAFPCCFNPHPPFLAGELLRRACSRARTTCFNPHPPFLAGELRSGW